MLCKDIHSALDPLLAHYDPEQICLVADEKTAQKMVSEPTLNRIKTLLLPVTESRKSLETVQQIWDFLFENGLTRRGVLVAAGGGVLTDMAGFAAATYKRGIDYINIPTTLLAMIDASSGGKTGINYHGLKNSIGVFAPPVETLIWPGWLETLPAAEFLSGFAEMLKTGLLEDAQRLWPQLLQYDLDTMDINTLAPLIEACVAVKTRFVAADPEEKGLRKALNLGHTFGHALEEKSFMTPSSRPMLHGYAVLYGLVAELYLSVTLLGCPKEPLQQLTQLMLHYYGRPQCNCSDRAQLITLMQQDKKNEHAAEINCTLLRAVGEPVINRIISPAQADEAWDYLFSL